MAELRWSSILEQVCGTSIAKVCAINLILITLDIEQGPLRIGRHAPFPARYSQRGNQSEAQAEGMPMAEL